MEKIAGQDEDDNNQNRVGKRIFIPAIGSLGDVKPYLILAKELKKRGHIVWLGVHKRFEQQITTAGKIFICRRRHHLLFLLYRYRYCGNWW